MKMYRNQSTRLLVRFVIDVILLIAIFIIALVCLPYWLKRHTPSETTPINGSLSTNTITTPFMLARRGFFCSDDSLAYPFQAERLLNKEHVVLLTTALPIAIILVVEMLREGFKRSNRQEATETQHQFTFVGLRIPTAISECYQIIGAYLFGLGLTVITTVFLKHWTGRLRPYFFDVCQPLLPDGTSCDDDYNFGVYIEDYTCSELATVSTDLLTTLRLSFPSGYATYTAYALGFLIFYLHARLHAAWLRLLRILLQFTGFATLALVAMERINSMQNHWTDVGAGIILGLIFAAFVAFVVLELTNPIAESQLLQKPTTPVRRQRHPK